MSDEQTNEVRDALIASAPQHERLIRSRDQVVQAWCEQHGVSKDELTIEQVLEIRKLPEWQHAT